METVSVSVTVPESSPEDVDTVETAVTSQPTRVPEAVVVPVVEAAVAVPDTRKIVVMSVTVEDWVQEVSDEED